MDLKHQDFLSISVLYLTRTRETEFEINLRYISFTKMKFDWMALWFFSVMTMLRLDSLLLIINSSKIYDQNLWFVPSVRHIDLCFLNGHSDFVTNIKCDQPNPLPSNSHTTSEMPSTVTMTLSPIIMHSCAGNIIQCINFTYYRQMIQCSIQPGFCFLLNSEISTSKSMTIPSVCPVTPRFQSAGRLHWA